MLFRTNRIFFVLFCFVLFCFVLFCFVEEKGGADVFISATHYPLTHIHTDIYTLTPPSPPPCYAPPIAIIWCPVWCSSR